MTPLRREIIWKPGYDYRKDPEKAEYGCCGLSINWYLHGPNATVQFLIMTPWLPTWEQFNDRISLDVLPADVGYHADSPQYEGHSPMDGCTVRPGGRCFYDGSSTFATDTFKLLVAEGHEAVWARLERFYKERFV